MPKYYVLPPNTCPTIDKAVDILHESAKDVIDYLEEIRKANSELREAAEAWEKEVADLEDERDKLQDELDEANERIKELEADRMENAA